MKAKRTTKKIPPHWVWQQWLKEETKDTRTSKSAEKKNHFNYKPKVTRLVRIKLSGETKYNIHQENYLYSLLQTKAARYKRKKATGPQKSKT